MAGHIIKIKIRNNVRVSVTEKENMVLIIKINSTAHAFRTGTTQNHHPYVQTAGRRQHEAMQCKLLWYYNPYGGKQFN